jgi:tetratricopeptide (TPR) repeat protein
MSISAPPDPLFDLWQTGRWRELERSALHILRFKTDDPSIHYLLGIARLKLEQAREAIAPLRMAVKLAPLEPTYRLGLSRALHAIGPNGRLEAMTLTIQSLALNPSAFECVWGLQDLIGDEPPADTALCWLLRALRLADPTNNSLILSVLVKCANAYHMSHQSVEAFKFFKMSAALDPANVDLLQMIAVTALNLACPDMSRRFFDWALALEPGNAGLLYGKGVLNLTCGDYKNGWPAFELRDAALNFPDRTKIFGSPVWKKGQNIAHKTILLTAEQGLGDTIQFSRLAAQVAALKAKVVLQVQDDLVDLLTGIPGILPKQIIGQSKQIPKHDVHCSLMSLPDRLDLRIDHIPVTLPYVSAKTAHVNFWQNEIVRLLPGPGPRIGLVWTGNPKHFKNSTRSIPVKMLQPLLSIPGIAWVSLSHEISAADQVDLEDQRNLLLLAGHIRNSFEDAAALVSLCDLIISIDTSFAHLAGAMGRPLLLALSKSPDFRWTLCGEHTPWYPTATLLRQDRLADWGPAIDQMRNKIQAMRDKLGK